MNYSESCTWTSQEIKEIIKDGLSIKLEYTPENWTNYPAITVKLLLDDKVIDQDYIEMMP